MILKPTVLADVHYLAQRIRACDRMEIQLGSGAKPIDVLRKAVNRSVIRETITTPSGSIAGIWGVVPIQDDLGSIWMLGSADLETIPTSFLKACRPAVAQAHVKFPTLVCAPWRENHLHLRWLRWLGFTIEEVGHPHFLKASHV